MIIVLQRVTQASVSVESQSIAQIGQGLLGLVGIAQGDRHYDIQYMVEKIPRLRIFEDGKGHMNLSLQDIQGELLLVSQFTLLANMAKGRRPSFENAAPQDEARRHYQNLLEDFQTLDIAVQGGRFGASMKVSLDNDGPVTLVLDSRTTLKGEKS